MVRIGLVGWLKVKKDMILGPSVEQVQIRSLREREQHYLQLIEAQSEVIQRMQNNPEYFAQVQPTQLRRVK